MRMRWTPTMRAFQNHHDMDLLWAFVTELVRMIAGALGRVCVSVVHYALVRWPDDSEVCRSADLQGEAKRGSVKLVMEPHTHNRCSYRDPHRPRDRSADLHAERCPMPSPV